LPWPRPPCRPTPGCAALWCPLVSAVPEPVVPGTASPPDEPVCGEEPATPDGPPGGPSGATGLATSTPLPVPGLPGAFACGLVSDCLLHADSVSRPAATTE